MVWFKRKNKQVIKEENNNNSEWKPDYASRERSYWASINGEVKVFRETGVDEEFITNYIIAHMPEGQGKLDGKEIWVCHGCSTAVKFDSRDDYIKHNLRIHG